jgi:hypothetical protein
MAYCEASDLLIGNIPLSSQYGDGTGFVDTATDEMDVVLGQLYETPIVLADTPANRPSQLWLKTCNKFIASGRLILDIAIAAEDDNLNAYGLSMLNQGLAMLKAIQDGAASITGATPLDPNAGAYQTGPVIFNEDSESLVKAGYEFLLDPWATSEWPPHFGSDVSPYS